jgi:hypothetical protein
MLTAVRQRARSTHAGHFPHRPKHGMLRGGRVPLPVGRAGFKPVGGRAGVFGRFDSCLFRPSLSEINYLECILSYTHDLTHTSRHVGGLGRVRRAIVRDASAGCDDRPPAVRSLDTKHPGAGCVDVVVALPAIDPPVRRITPTTPMAFGATAGAAPGVARLRARQMHRRRPNIGSALPAPAGHKRGQPATRRRNGLPERR